MKAKIIKVGYINSEDCPVGFVFDCDSSIPGISIQDNGEILYGGWTVQELKETTK